MQYSLYCLSRSKVGSNTIQYCTLAICIRIYENQVIELASIRNRFKIVFLTHHNLLSPLLAGARASDGGLLRAGLRQQGRQDHTAGKITLFSWIKPKITLRMLSVLRRSSQSSTNVSELRIDFILKLLKNEHSIINKWQFFWKLKANHSKFMHFTFTIFFRKFSPDHFPNSSLYSLQLRN